ncbi:MULTISPECIES: hypothetical protein [unclassified Variovorax]|uniref:hypothetical protein n=1 Tax=unclassified Variovorax TaxID=663243 RepID=UPI00076C26E1|nr:MULTISPECIES: hypothetical protein [unclassified Variovorax]KWT98390.1 hypothetical protein APY03_0525 [Variovorax sp. WDL1]PNG49946.1 hypothetical protein CHC06_05527 [Variovorax sp. B2]PNG50818.1 hypothetical protein CHC07_05432 [Variovorax sp. B4]VTV18044.1 hypothetical protein WDL1P1_00870 [Variovorax sp. WDL1]
MNKAAVPLPTNDEEFQALAREVSYLQMQKQAQLVKNPPIDARWWFPWAVTAIGASVGALAVMLLKP